LSILEKVAGLFSPREKTAVPAIKVDMHSHLIPGIDDGSKSMQQSISLITELKDIGYEKLITTPHIMQHRYPNSSRIILNGLKKLKEELQRQKIDIEIEAAAEYYLDDHLYDLLKKDDILTFGDNYLLFEMSYVMAPADLETIVFEMQCSGYKPVLAHPERFIHMHPDFNKYKALKERDVFFQVDINSLGGYYSKPVQKIAIRLTEEGMVDFIGTDTHHQRHIKALQNTLKSKNYIRLFEKNDILNNTLL